MEKPENSFEIQNKKAILNRLSRAMGHMDYVKRMVEDNRDPSDILIQLSAVESAIRSTGTMMIENEVEKKLEDGTKEEIVSLLKAMERYCK